MKSASIRLRMGKPVHHRSHIKLPENGLEMLSGCYEKLLGVPLPEDYRLETQICYSRTDTVSVNKRVSAVPTVCKWDSPL
jgi:hypothetical protein